MSKFNKEKVAFEKSLADHKNGKKGKTRPIPNLVGLTITGIVQTTIIGDEDNKEYFVIELSDGGKLWMEQDDEGNGPGTFMYSKGDAPEIHAWEFVQ